VVWLSGGWGGWVDDPVIGYGFNGNRLLHEAIEELAATF